MEMYEDTEVVAEAAAAAEVIGAIAAQQQVPGYTTEQVVDEASGEVRTLHKRPGRARQGKTWAHFVAYDGVVVRPGTQPIWLYLRLSRYHKDGSDAIDRQRIDLTRKLEAEGCWTIMGEIVDNDSASPYAERDRKGFAPLKEEIAAGRVQALAFWKLDRVDRDAARNIAFVGQCIAAGVELRSHQDSREELNAARGAGKAIRAMKAVFGEMEADTMSDRQLASKAHAAENGFFHGGQRPFGWMPGPRVELADGRRGKRLVPHPLEFPAVVDAVRMAAFEGRSTADIGEYWRDRYGIVGADGEPMYQGTVHKVLTSPRLLGHRLRIVPGEKVATVVRYERDVVGQCVCAACTDDPATPKVAPGELLHRAGDPLIAMRPVCDLDTWLALQAALRARDTVGLRRTKAKYGSKVRPLSGLLYCGRCARTLTAQPRKLASGRVGVRYRCKTRQNRGKSVCEGLCLGGDGAELWVEEFVLTYLDDAKLAEARALVDEEVTRRSGVPSTQTRLAEARQRKDLIIQAYESGASYRGTEGYRDYRREMDGVNQLIDELTAELEVTTGVAGPTIDASTNVELRELWTTFDDARKRAVYDQVIGRIVVTPAQRERSGFDSDRLQVKVRF